MTANEKRSVALKGRKKSPEHIEKVRLANLGSKRSAESCQRMRLSHLGKQPSEITCARLSVAQKRAYAEGKRACSFTPEDWQKATQLSRLRTGSKHPRWIADRSKLALVTQTRTGADIAWARAVKRRDFGVCVLFYLGGCRGRLEAHHIRSWKHYPHLRYDVDNGITLCLAHHPRKQSEAKLLEAIFQQMVINKKG
jgi:hypothetical protein